MVASRLFGTLLLVPLLTTTPSIPRQELRKPASEALEQRLATPPAPYQRPRESYAQRFERVVSLIGYHLASGIGSDAEQMFCNIGVTAVGAKSYNVSFDDGNYMVLVAGPVGCNDMLMAAFNPEARPPVVPEERCLFFDFTRANKTDDTLVGGHALFRLPSGSCLIGFTDKKSDAAVRARSYLAWVETLEQVEQLMQEDSCR